MMTMLCPNRKIKRHLATRSNPKRTNQHSRWRCYLLAGHRGICKVRPNAHQSPWGIWVRLDSSFFEQNRPES